MVSVASAFIVVYPLAALCGCVAAACLYRRALVRDPSFSRRFRFLFGRWRPGACYRQPLWLVACSVWRVACSMCMCMCM